MLVCCYLFSLVVKHEITGCSSPQTTCHHYKDSANKIDDNLRTLAVSNFFVL